MSTRDELRATQRWLALEHEAIWTYALVGARFGGLLDAARREDAAHRRTRDGLQVRVRVLGGRPVATAVTYALAEADDVASARSLARDVESRIAAACVRLVAVTDDDARDRAVDGLRRAAVTQVRWGGDPEPFPGLD